MRFCMAREDVNTMAWLSTRSGVPCTVYRCQPRAERPERGAGRVQISPDASTSGAQKPVEFDAPTPLVGGLIEGAGRAKISPAAQEAGYRTPSSSILQPRRRSHLVCRLGETCLYARSTNPLSLLQFRSAWMTETPPEGGVVVSRSRQRGRQKRQEEGGGLFTY
jgi:hypothetical protein